MIDRSSTVVSIVTVNYYSEKDLLECYKSIYAKSKCSFELILVSNSPIDPAFEHSLKQHGIHVRIIETNENLGFAKACNIGAQHSSGEFLFFLNPDTRFLNDTIEELFQCFDKYPTVGMIGPHTFDENDNSVGSVKNEFSAGYLFHLMFPPFAIFLKQDKLIGHFLPEKTQEVSVVNGHAMFITSELFNTLGGMEERFFMYWEENDLCKRIHEVNRSVHFCREAKVVHIGSTSTNRFFYEMEIEKHRSQLKFVTIHFSDLLLLNRLTGILGYFWRTIISLFLFRKHKVKQFWTLFVWYAVKYK